MWKSSEKSNKIQNKKAGAARFLAAYLSMASISSLGL